MGIKEDITKIYVGYYDRAPDPAGLNYWIGRANAGMTLSEIAQSFAVQTESTTKYPYLANPLVASADSFIDSVYMNLFNRAPDAEGKAYWLAQLAGGKPVGQMIIDIMSGAKDDANGKDLTTLNNKVEVGIDWATDLANVAGLDYENNASAKASAAAVLNGVTDDAATVASAKAETDAFVSAGAGAGTTTNLTTGVDSVVGGTGADVIVGSDTTLTGLDSINGGDGVDTLKLSDVAGNTVDLSVATISNIEKLELSSTKGLKTGTLDASGLTGLTNADISLTAIAADQTITVPTTAALKLTGNVTAASNIALNGGKTSEATIKNAVDNSGSTITVTGDAATSFVAVKQTQATAAWAAGVSISDKEAAVDTKPGTLETVVIDGLTGAAATVNSDALATLKVKNSDQNVTVDNDTASHALAIELDNVTGGVIADAVATTLNVSTKGKKSSGVDLDADAATALNIDAAVDLALTTTALAADDTVKTVTLKGAGGVTADLSGVSSLTSVDASASTGANDISIDGTAATYTGGSGADKVTVTATATKAIDGGAGTEDTLVLNGAAGAAQVGTKATNFEILGLGAAATGSYDADGFSKLTHGAVAGAVTYTNVAADPTLTITATTGNAATISLKSDVGTSDTVNVKITGAADINANTLTAANVENVVINTDDTATTPTGLQHTLTLVATSAPTVTISGDAGLALTNANTALTSVDASGITKGDFSFTTGALTNAATIKGGAGDDTINASAATKAMTIDGGNGTNALTGSSTAANTITGGSGVDTIVGGSGVDTINAGDGDDVITSGKGLDMLTLGGGNDTVNFAINDNGNTYSTILDIAAGDKIVSTDAGQISGTTTFTSAKITLADTAAFQDYLDAAVNASGDNSTDSNVAWFQYAGNTYLVEDNSNAATFQNGADAVIKLTGLHDLSDDTFAAVATTSWTLTIV